jgi:aminoglycoside phosphotransferase (APT) family kinase protein
MSSPHQFRPGLEFDVDVLEVYLRGVIAGFSRIDRVTQFAGGQSNPTYRVDAQVADRAHSFALRRKPPGVLAPSAHAIEREFRVMHALQITGFPVAKAWVLCEDVNVIGTAFYIMDCLDGRIFWDPSLPEVEFSERMPIFFTMAETLADLHRVDVTSVGLTDYGKAEGYVARQVARWSKLYLGDIEVAGRVPAMERLMEWLPANAPAAEPAPTLVHGDFRIDNMVFAKEEARVLGVLDWELSTIGNPEADFAYNFMMYRVPSAAIPGLMNVDLAKHGLPSERQYVDRYCRRRGISDIPALDYYVAFCMFRLAGIFHGIRGRFARGTAVSPKAKEYAGNVELMADLAWQQVERSR